MQRDGRIGGGDAVVAVRRPQSLATMVVDQIRDLIVAGRLDLGEQLSENALAERLGVSRTPVREAFLRLEAERLVEVRPQRGTFVFLCDDAQIRDLCELREVLETGALRLALAHDRDHLAIALREAVQVAAEATVPDAASYQPFDTEFHETLVRASRNAELIEAYARVSGRVRTLRWRYIRSLDQVRRSQADHRAIVDHVLGDADGEAEALLRHHVYNSYRGFLGLAPDRDGEAATA